MDSRGLFERPVLRDEAAENFFEAGDEVRFQLLPHLVVGHDDVGRDEDEEGEHEHRVDDDDPDSSADKRGPGHDQHREGEEDGAAQREAELGFQLQEEREHLAKDVDDRGKDGRHEVDVSPRH